MKFKPAWCSLALVVVPVVSMAEVRVTPSLSLGYKTLNTEVFKGGFDLDDVSMPTIGGALTVGWNKFSVSGYVESSLRDESTSASLDASFLEPGEPGFDFDVDVNRLDVGVSLGYALTDRWSVFAGYMRSDTEYEPQIIGGTISSEFVDSGVIAGARFVALLTEFGSLSVHGGYAQLNTELDVDIEIDGNPEDSGKSHAKNDSMGASVGAVWVGAVPGWEHFNYLTSFRLNKFTYESNEPGIGDLDNNLQYLSVGLMYSM